MAPTLPAPAAPKFFTTVAQARAAQALDVPTQVQFKAGRGYYLAPKAPASAAKVALPGGSNLYATALKLAQQAEAPNISAINAEQGRYDTNAATEMQNEQGFVAALAKMLGGEGPAVQSAYDNAAGATAGFAKGLSDAEAHIAQNENASLSDFLTKQGLTPEQIAAATSKIGGVPASDVTYGLGGYIPSAGLEREGAAFSAAADNQPATATGQGLETQASMAKTQADQDFQYAQQLAQERGKVPGEAQTLLNDMLTRLQQQESINIQKGYLGNSTRTATANIQGLDPVTGQPKAGYYVDPGTGAVIKDGYIVNPKGQIVRAPTAGTNPTAKASKARETAFQQAQVKIFAQAKSLAKPMTLDQQIAWVAAHPGQKLADAPKTTAPDYATAAKSLFDEYKYLLRFATQSGQPALKRRLNAIISDALGSVGIKAPVKGKAPKTGTFPTAQQIFTGGGL